VRVWLLVGLVLALSYSGHHGVAVAYIGPGAGFAFLGSFLTLLGGFFLSIVSLVTWPFRLLYRSIVLRKYYKRAQIKKLIFLGLDGLDPGLTEKFMAEGKLPNFSKIAGMGGYKRLRTTFPPLSPVAWSTFATGVNPARHNMFDFLNRNLNSYTPELSSTRVRKPKRMLNIGKYHLPLSKPFVELRRKSRTFWSILSQHHIGSTILRVPITFPPEKFNGRLLSAMCTPDLLGTQGTFALFTTDTTRAEMEGGNQFPLEAALKGYTGEILGPQNYMVDGADALKIPFILTPGKNKTGTLQIDGERHQLNKDEFTPWITLTFRAPLGIKVRGIVRFLLSESERGYSLYMTPINIDPENPELPISHPTYYAAYLAKLLGTYATLGMAEDTWAMNEHAIDEDAFLQQAYLTYEERERMFLSALDRTRHGVVACVFDTTDRVQHMFFRHMKNGGAHGRIIEDLYKKADELVGKALLHVESETVLFVLSDHGFTSFERGVNLNTWLLENGYLALKSDAAGRDYLKDIDWSRTKAYTFGLAGIYLNLRGRESQGIVENGAEASSLRKELAEKLSGLMDADRIGIRSAWPSETLYRGPYLTAAPDLIVGYAEGYRASWDAAVGKISSRVFEDNEKAWSGDHCVDPNLVPGVLFCNRKIQAADPGIEDMAPTTLQLFGIPIPAYMEGKPVLTGNDAAAEKEAAA
jgi:predicted AlkP superfamily phosphohydrolase/phosphomutase